MDTGTRLLGGHWNQTPGVQILALPLANSVTLNLSPKHSISFLKIKNGNDDNNGIYPIMSRIIQDSTHRVRKLKPKNTVVRSNILKIFIALFDS